MNNIIANHDRGHGFVASQFPFAKHRMSLPVFEDGYIFTRTGGLQVIAVIVIGPPSKKQLVHNYLIYRK